MDVLNMTGNNNNNNNSSSNNTVCNIIHSSLTFLVGSSSSGKSSLLKIIAGVEEPASGQLTRWTGTNTCRIDSLDKSSMSSELSSASSSSSMCLPFCPKAIVLDDRDPYSTKSQRDTLEERLEDRLKEIMKACPDTGSTKSTRNRERDDDCLQSEQRAIIRDISVACGLVGDGGGDSGDINLLHKTPADLTRSQYFHLRLAEACMESSCYGYPYNCNNNNNLNKFLSSSEELVLPGPVLLLDEWFDIETSSIVMNVKPALQRIVSNLNGIVVVVTHKPHLFQHTKYSYNNMPPINEKMKSKPDRVLLSSSHDDSSTHSASSSPPLCQQTTVTLSSGKILSIHRV